LSATELLVEVRVHVRNCRLQEYRARVGAVSRNSICACNDKFNAPFGDVTNCSVAVETVCENAAEAQVFEAMCTVCAQTQSLQGACLREVDRAVRLAETRGLCNADGLGLPMCETETLTEPGPEPFIFARQQRLDIASGFTPLGNSYGGEGALSTTGFA
jgi:hypothetical protein